MAPAPEPAAESAPVAASPDAASPDAASPVDAALKPTWSAFPVAGVDSDDGFGFGARAQLDIPAPGVLPYKRSFVLHLFLTTHGYHSDRFRFDLVQIGPAHNLRLTGQFAYRAWLNDGYWGLGNGTVRDPAYDALPDGDPGRKHYRYQLIQPFAHLTLRDDLAAAGVGRVSAYGSFEARYSVVRTYAGSLLEAERPYGMDGGAAVQVGGGVLWDARAPEVTPARGALLELSGRVVGTAVPDAVGPAALGAFGGPFASARTYVPVMPRVVFATRLMGEWLFGRVPFYEMVQWGGFVPISGMGGADTLRGASFGRWHGPGKAVLQDELRIDVLTHRALKHELRWQLVPFADVGAVWGVDLAGGEGTAPSGPPLHPAAGLGVRGIFATTLVGRLDVAVGQDPQPGGSMGRSLGFYLAFDHTY